jgi:phage repressor protein C with HTH and peptisase S24 domain
MDDKETLHRRARLRELVSFCFDNKPANLLRHISDKTGKPANQGELSALMKDDGGKSFGDKKAKTLTLQIGLFRRWFDFPIGSNLQKAQWMSPAPGESSVTAYDAHDSVQPGYIRLEHLSASPSMGVGTMTDEPVHVVRHIDVLERWVREEIGSTDPKRIKILTAVGRSMQPTINDRDLVFIDITCCHIDAPGIYVIDVAGRLLLKKAMIQSDGTLILRSDNIEEYPDEERYQLAQAAETITVCGKVMAWWTLRKG